MIIGIYGGSFNPVHKGHVELARSIVEQGLVDELWLLVSPVNPLKQTRVNEYAPYDDRLRMAELATKSVSGIRVSDFESKLPTPSYTHSTLTALAEAYPQHTFTLVVGADNWQSFDKWYRAEDILSQHHVLVYNRPGCTPMPVGMIEGHANAEVVDTPLFDISSTELRHAIRCGEDTADWLAPEVVEYIKVKRLYE